MSNGFSCRRCGRCCRWAGYVKLEAGESETIAGFLGLTHGEFLERFTRISRDRRHLVLAEAADGSCIFLEGDSPAGCRIEPVKPRQCRDFPEHWNFPGWQEECPGANGAGK